jgi:hypothetical protein
MIITIMYISDSSHPVVAATASVALWSVLHHSEQARAVARGILGKAPQRSKNERFDDSNVDDNYNNGYNSHIIINKDDDNPDTRYQKELHRTADKARNALWKYLE